MKLRSKNWLYDPIVGNFLSWMIAGLILMPYVNDNTDNVILFPIALLAGSIWTIWLHSYRESIRIEIHHKIINHSARFIIRSAIAILIGLATHLLARSENKLLLALVAAVYLGSIFWLLFDFFLNHHRGLHWNYRSKSDSAATTDKIFKEKLVWWLTTKVGLFLLATLLYYRVLQL